MKPIQTFFGIFFLLFFYTNTSFSNTYKEHPLHLSVCNIDYNAEAHSLEITYKFFIDDLEAGILQRFGEKIRLDGTQQDNKDEDDYLIKYLETHFSIKINGKNTEPVYKGKQLDHEGVWIYLEIENVKKIKQMEILNSPLLSVFDDQKNLFFLNYQKEKKSLVFEKSEIKQTLSF